MSLEMKKTSKWWYARIQANGKSKQFNLGVEIKGRRPNRISQIGDRLFEQTRALAEKKHVELKNELLSQRHSEEYIQQLHEVRTGSRIISIPIQSLPSEWEIAPRRKKGSPRYIKESKSKLMKFSNFMESQYPDITVLSDVTADMAEVYMRHVTKTGISARTWNATLILLRSAFKALTNKAKIVKNPFYGIPTREEKTIHRKPYSEKELKAIIDVLNIHTFIRPVIMTGICTAMRQGDCCLLMWEDVDLDNKFITVKTSKTGEKVEIPMFPILEEEILKHINNRSVYVFPKRAEMYQINRHGIGVRVRNALQDAGFTDNRNTDRTDGIQRGSIKDFHSFRVTWITLALSAGIPLELVRRVTGHKTTDVVLKHYFRPGREDFRKAISQAMPKLLTQNSAVSKGHPTILSLLKEMNEKNWENKRNKIMTMIHETSHACS